MDQLAAMRTFVAVAERGGFVAAGRRLGLSGPMVGNHVRFLEAQLGGLILNRTTRAQSLTELGRTYLDGCRRVFAELDAAEADAAALLGAARGSLRVTAPHSIGSTILPPVIAAFLSENPLVDVHLHLDDRRVDLMSDGFDVAIRSGHVDDAGLITRALAPLELVVCAAPSYIERASEPVSPSDLASHNCLDFAASATPGFWRFEGADGLLDVRIAGRFRTNGGVALKNAALDGLGIILQPEMMVRDEIARGRLVLLLSGHHPESRPIRLLTLPDRKPPPKLRRFIDMVVRHLGSRSSPKTRSVRDRRRPS